ncbi:MAG: phage portal protein [Dehalococcoidia bacterium]|nr:phage portal protein [Dehalococcoidia bacterium]
MLGPGVVEPWETQYGHANDTFSPPEYGNYIATSNGVYVCAKLRADTLSGLPLKLYRVMRGGKKVEVEKGNLYALLQKVNPFWTMSRLLNVTELSLSLWGESFWFLERGTSGKQPPKEIWWGRPDRVTVVPHPTDYISGFIYNPENGSPPIPFLPQEVVWHRYPNPTDEYEGLSPLAAARLAADTSTAAMQTNAGIFKNGLMPAGMVFPKQDNVTWTKEQADELEKLLDKRFKGQDKAHKLAVFRTQFDIRNTELTPKDAEFLGMLKWNLEDICRAYGIPLDLVGGERTYENVAAAERALFMRTMGPECKFIASELTEQLLPMFPGEADLAEFDLSEIEVLHEAETAKWARASDKIARGAITINEWREGEGLEMVPWGDAWWAPISLVPISAKKPVPAEAGPEETLEPEPEETAPAEERMTRAVVRAVEYGSPEHERVWTRYTAQTSKWEEKFAAKVRDLFKRQKASVLAKLKERGKRQDELADNPFNKAQWTKTFRVEARPLLEAIVADFGAAALSSLALEAPFDTSTANVARMIERQAQRFAKQVNDTTWEALKASLSEGVQGGEGVPQLAERVTQLMDGRIESSAETIARTEVIGASNGGTVEAWDQSGVVAGREWISALDERTRTPPDSEFDHLGAHGEVVGADEPFVRTGEELMWPGDPSGSVGNLANCRCTVAPVLDIDRAAQAAAQRAIVKASPIPVVEGGDMRSEDWLRLFEAFARSAQQPGITVRADNFTAQMPEQKAPEIRFEPQIVVNVPPPNVPEIIIQVPQAAPPDIRVDIPQVPVTLQQQLVMPTEETTTEVVERDDAGRAKKIKRTKKVG